jgi:hypothetical protein
MLLGGGGKGSNKKPQDGAGTPGASRQKIERAAAHPISFPMQMLISLEFRVVASGQLPNCSRATFNRRAEIIQHTAIEVRF